MPEVHFKALKQFEK